jgi:hypothetical protein
VTGAELSPPQPETTSIAAIEPASARYAHLPHTERLKVARAASRPVHAIGR